MRHGTAHDPALRTPHSALGVTLVELLIAMTILVVITSSTTLIFRGISRAWRNGQLRTERYQQARLLFDLFSREITATVANNRYPLVGLDAAQEEKLHPGSAADELFFVGTLPGRTGLVERGYWLNDKQQLMCHDDEPADAAYASGEDEVCGTGIGNFDISYFDGTQWVDRWDARPLAPQAGRLPKAVHIILLIGTETPKQFDAVIYVPTS